MSKGEFGLIAAAAAAVAAVLGFRAGRLAAKTEWRQAHGTAAPAGAEAPATTPPTAAPVGEGGSDFSEWEQAALPRDS